MRRRRSELPKLERRAAALREELAEIEARIASLGEPVAAAPAPTPARSAAQPGTRTVSGAARRTRNGQPTIGEQIAEILAAHGGVMRPVEIAELLGKRLAREVNQNFQVQVSLTLARMVQQGRVAKVGRGQYSAKGAAVASMD